MQSTMINNMTLQLYSPQLERAFWLAPGTTSTLLRLDLLGTCFSLSVNLIYLFFHSSDASWAIPLIGAATAAAQLLFLRFKAEVYLQHRVHLQLFQRLLRMVPMFAAVFATRTIYQMFQQSQQVRRLESMGGVKALGQLLLQQPLLMITHSVNHYTSFRCQLALFALSLALDLFGVIPFFGCVMMNLQLDRFGGPICMVLDNAATILFALMPPPPISTSRQCSLHPQRFLPAFALVLIGNFTPLLGIYWFERQMKQSFLTSRRRAAAVQVQVQAEVVHTMPANMLVMLHVYVALAAAYGLALMTASQWWWNGSEYAAFCAFLA